MLVVPFMGHGFFFLIFVLCYQKQTESVTSMIANYHTHTWRCHHAGGTERQYIESAIAAGIKTLGFSDHTPYPFRGSYYSNYRMYVHQAEDYFRTLTDLKAEYADQIQIRIGVEAEYYPDLFGDLLVLLRQYPCEYMLMGQHFVGNEENDHYVYVPSADPVLLKRYVDQVLEGLETGLFTYLAHPDLFTWRGDEQTYRREMERLCLRVKELGYVVEYNLLGHYDHRNYPTEAFWHIAAQVGNTVILGIDGHKPEALDRPQTEQEALRFLRGLGIQPIETIDLKSIT